MLICSILVLNLGCKQKTDLKDFIKENPKIGKLNCTWESTYAAGVSNLQDYYYKASAGDTVYRLNFSRINNQKFEFHYLSKYFLKGDTIYRLSLSQRLDTLFYLKEPFDGNTYLNPRKLHGKKFYKGESYYKTRFGLD